ncbi:MAG TPA: GNAT family N-acetyltransferase [Burkholderiaceae bacterium]
MLDWQWKTFGELSARDVYDMLALRSAVFVVEQQCVYQDIDGADRDALHLLGWHTGASGRTLGAYARVFAPGLKFDEAAIGRVIAAPAMRGTGAGRALMAEALAGIAQHWPGQATRISAQRYLERFYASFGFTVCSEPYLEDGIPHIDMLRV